MRVTKRMLFILLLVGISFVSISALSGKTAHAASTTHSRGLIRAETTVNNHQKLVSSKVAHTPPSVTSRVPPPPADCITLWGGASNIQKFGVVASYNVKVNLWNTCGSALKGQSNGWTAVIDIECWGAWINQGSVSGSLPALSNNQQLLPLFYYNFKSTCVDRQGDVSLPDHISVAVAADTFRTDNNTEVNGGVDIPVY